MKMSQILELAEHGEPLTERQKSRRVRKLAGVGHRSGSDSDKIKSEFAAQKSVSKHSSEVLAYLANLPTTGHNTKVRKQARKFLAMRGHPCKPGEKMTFGVCRKVGVRSVRSPHVTNVESMTMRELLMLAESEERAS